MSKEQLSDVLNGKWDYSDIYNKDTESLWEDVDTEERERAMKIRIRKNS